LFDDRGLERHAFLDSASAVDPTCVSEAARFKVEQKTVALHVVPIVPMDDVDDHSVLLLPNLPSFDVGGHPEATNMFVID
jgi:hypothetical protein